MINEERYIMVPEKMEDGSIDLKWVFKPVKKLTTKLRETLKSLRYVNINLKLDIHRHFMMKISVIDLKQIWVAGKELMIQQKPELNTQIKSFCAKTKKYCCGFEGDISNEYFAICPHCNHIYVGVEGIDVPCDWCKDDIKFDPDNVKWIKYLCVNCPVNIGLDEANLNLEYAYNNQYYRKYKGIELGEQWDEINQEWKEIENGHSNKE